MIKGHHYKPFPGKFATISENSQQKFFLKSVFDEVGNSRLTVCDVRE